MGSERSTDESASPATSLKSDLDDDPELVAMAKVVAAVKGLDAAARQRVLEYATRRLGLQTPFGPITDRPIPRPQASNKADGQDLHQEHISDREDTDDRLEGISEVARKWMRRNDLSPQLMSELFSLGVDDIDLVAKSVPGKNTKGRLRSVVLLQGIASYLGTGVARIEWQKLKQAAAHYDADAGTNFATYMKSLGAEATGSASAGFTLTSRGLNAAKDLIKEMSELKK